MIAWLKRLWRRLRLFFGFGVRIAGQRSKSERFNPMRRYKSRTGMTGRQWVRYRKDMNRRSREAS